MIYVFADCSLDIDRRELRRGNDAVAVEPQVFDLLHYLVQNRERVVSKDDLIAHVWNGRIVSDSSLSSRIAAVRRAVGDGGDQQRLIRTIPRKGLRFVGEVREDRNTGHAGAAQPSPHVERDTVPLTSLSPPPLPDKPSIAVLPFTNMSGDPEQEYFSDGITEDVITALSRLRWFFVIARNSTFVYKGQAVDVRHVGRDLGVRYVLEGSVRKSGQRVRISSQLLEATTGSHIWTERYDRELTDIFALQDEITASVTAAIEPKLLAAEGMRTETRSIEDLNAWDLVARALSHFGKMTAADSDAAIAILREAVARHPTYAPAHSILAFALLVSFQVGWMPTSGNKDVAARLAHRAAELDSDDPWAHMALGYLAITDRRTDEAVRHFQVALDLNPNFAAAYGYTGWALVLDGQSEEALRHFGQWMRMSPRDPLTGFLCAGISAAHYFAARYDEAIKWARQGVQLRPGMPAGHRMLCVSLAQAGLIDEAGSAMAHLRELQPTLSVAWVKQSVPYTARPMALFLDGLRKAGLTH
jgi:TolB-like protein/Flp pilus assembly protein TadD